MTETVVKGPQDNFSQASINRTVPDQGAVVQTMLTELLLSRERKLIQSFDSNIHAYIPNSAQGAIILPEHNLHEYSGEVLTREQRAAFGRQASQSVHKVESRLSLHNLNPCLGAERELTLIASDGSVLKGTGPEVLRAVNASENPLIAAHTVPELHNSQLEHNSPVFAVGPDMVSQLDSNFRDYDRAVQAIAAQYGARVGSFGLVPSLGAMDMHPMHLTDNPRYKCLAAAVQDAFEQEDSFFHWAIPCNKGWVVTSFYRADEGGGELKIVKPDGKIFQLGNTSVLLESLMTSLQVHIPVETLESYVGMHRVAEMLSPAFVGLSASSPFIDMEPTGFSCSRNGVLWQAGVSPWRTCFIGDSWISSPVEQFRQASDLGPYIPPEMGGKHKGASADEGVRVLHETAKNIWPLVRTTASSLFKEDGTLSDQIDLRLESRSMSPGPTISDEVAHTIFSVAVVPAIYKKLQEAGVPIDSSSARQLNDRMNYAELQSSFARACVDGLSAKVSWINGETLELHDLIREELLPAAKAYLVEKGVPESEIESCFKSLEQRLDFDWNQVSPEPPRELQDKKGMNAADIQLYLNHTLPLIDPRLADDKYARGREITKLLLEAQAYDQEQFQRTGERVGMIGWFRDKYLPQFASQHTTVSNELDELQMPTKNIAV